MRPTNEFSVSKILSRSIVTAMLLTMLETCLIGAVKIVAQALIHGNVSGLAGVNPFLSIVKGTGFVFIMRILLGFVCVNAVVWALIAFMKLRLSQALICLANVASVLVMYWIWDWKYNILHDLLYLKTWSDVFGWYQTGLLSSFVGPIPFRRFVFRLNILPSITKFQE